MVGPIAKLFIPKGFIWGSFLVCLPYTWSAKLGKPVVTKSKWRLFGCKLYLVASFLVMLQLIIRSVKAIFDESRETQNLYPSFTKQILIVYTVGFILCFGVAAPVFMSLHELPMFVEAYVKYFETKENQESTSRYKKSKKLNLKSKQRFFALNDLPGRFIALLFYSSFVFHACTACMTFVSPQLPIFAFVLDPNFNIFQDKLNIKICLKIAFNIISFNYVIAGFLCNLYFWGFTGMPYVFDLIDCLQHLTNQVESDATMHTGIGNGVDSGIEAFVRKYQELQLLHEQGQFIYCRVLVAVSKWLIIILTTYCIFICIRMEGIIVFVLFSCVQDLLLYQVVAFKIYGRVYEFSSDLISSWEKKLKTKYGKKMLRTVRPLKVTVGSFYYIDKEMLLTAFQTIVEMTVDLLVASG